MATKIQWAEESWNPIVAYDIDSGLRGWHCEKVSAGCKFCYAEQRNMSQRCNLGTGFPFRPASREHIRIELDEKTLLKPIRWRKPRLVFVCSMTDLFMDAHTDGMLDQVFAIIAMTPHITYIVLTKRIERAQAYLSHRYRNRSVPANMWLLATCENQATADARIPVLLQCPAAVRGVSAEPMLGPVDFVVPWKESRNGTLWCVDSINGHWCNDSRDLGDRIGMDMDVKAPWPGRAPRLDWVIVGGEFGKGARPCNVEWIRETIRQCRDANVPCFVKQLGSNVESYMPDVYLRITMQLQLRHPKGGDPDEWPQDIRVRQYPKVLAA